MALANGKIYLLGSLTSYRNQYMANNLVKIDPDGNVDTTFSVQVSNSGCDNIVRALAINDYHVFVGGDFVKCRGVSANRVAKLDLLTGAVDTMDFNPSASNGVNGVVRAVLVSNNDVYIGGDFTTYRGVTVNRIVKTNLLGAVDSTFKGSGTVGITSANTGVYALAINGSSLYVGGSFTLYRGATVARLLKLNTSDGSSDATFATTGANSTILSLAVANSSLYVGGAFTSFKGQAMNYLAKASLSDASPDLTFKSALATTGTNRNVNAIYSDGSFLYVGGTFTAYRGTTTNCMMAVDHSTGDPDTTFRSVGGITGSTVSINSISSRGDGTVTFGGNMMLYGGQVSPMIVTVGVNGVAN
jgi:hypothetical protein